LNALGFPWLKKFFSMIDMTGFGVAQIDKKGNWVSMRFSHDDFHMRCWVYFDGFAVGIRGIPE